MWDDHDQYTSDHILSVQNNTATLNYQITSSNYLRIIRIRLAWNNGCKSFKNVRI